MAATKLKQGESLDIVLEVLDQSDSPVNLVTDVEQIHLLIYTGGVQKAKYSVNALTGYEEAEVDGIDNWKLNFTITREQSKTFEVGQLLAIVIIKRADPLLTNEYAFILGSVQLGLGKDDTI